MDSDGHLIGVTGSYHITSVTVTSLANPTQQANGRALYVPLDAGQWIGATPNAPALKDLWEQAHRSSAIHREGLFMSEHNRLNRIAHAAASGDTTSQRRELATFIDDVTTAGTVIDQGRQQRILAYATALQATVGR